MGAAAILNEVRSYPVEKRAAFADAVLQTLNPVDGEDQRKWIEVAARRRREILSGEVEPIAASEVLAEAYSRALA